MTELEIAYTPATSLVEANQDLADALEIARLALEEAERRNGESASPSPRSEHLAEIRVNLRAAAIRTAQLPDHEPMEPEGNPS